MPANARLIELEHARRAARLEADLQRTLLRVETAALRDRVRSLTLGRAAQLSKSPLLLGGGALASLLVAGRMRRVLRWAPSLLLLYRWFKSSGAGGRKGW